MISALSPRPRARAVPREREPFRGAASASAEEPVARFGVLRAPERRVLIAQRPRRDARALVRITCAATASFHASASRPCRARAIERAGALRRSRSRSRARARRPRGPSRRTRARPVVSAHSERAPSSARSAFGCPTTMRTGPGLAAAAEPAFRSSRPRRPSRAAAAATTPASGESARAPDPEARARGSDRLGLAQGSRSPPSHPASRRRCRATRATTRRASACRRYMRR